MTCVTAGRYLDHLQSDQLGRWIDPEGCAPHAFPGERTDRSGHSAPLWIGSNRKPESPTRAYDRPDRGDAVNVPYIGRQRASCHFQDGCRSQEPHAIEFSAVQQHLAKAQIVDSCRYQPTAAGEKSCWRHPSGMALEDAGEDQIAHRQRRIERLRRAAAGVAQCLFGGPADPALPSRGRVQAQQYLERRCGGPERTRTRLGRISAAGLRDRRTSYRT